MTEDIDVEALLEAPFRKDEQKSDRNRDNGLYDKKSSGKSSKHRSRSRSRSHSRSGRSRHRSRSKSRKGSRSPKKSGRSRSHSRSRSRPRSPHFRGGRYRVGKRRSPSPYSKGSKRHRSPVEELTPEERDARTIFCMQLSQRIRARDLEQFFGTVGKVRDVRMITCNKTKRFKGIAYIEFKDPDSVPLALGLNGQKLLGVPVVVQHTQAEKNRIGNPPPRIEPKINTGPMRLYIGSLHFNITEDMLKGIFEPFGKIDSIQLIYDPETGRSKGYGFLTFRNSEDAKKALEQLNGFELAGRPMKVGNVSERADLQQGVSLLDNDELDRSGIELGATGRLQLMFKLAEGAGLQVPAAAANALSVATGQPVPTHSTKQTQSQPKSTPPIATQCFMLSNMFDPATETGANWDSDIRDDVIEECNRHGGVLHVYVDKASQQGNVYVKCPTINTAVAAVDSLHGRWFAGRVITAAYVPLVNYHALFPDAVPNNLQLLQPSINKKMFI